MKDKMILGSWCTEPYCKFIDSKHIQIELVAHIWYSYNNDSKTDVINKKLCFVKEIDFNDLNDTVEILEEQKKIPEKCDVLKHCIGFNKNENVLLDNQLKLQDKINSIIDYLESKGDE